MPKTKNRKPKPRKARGTSGEPRGIFSWPVAIRLIILVVGLALLLWLYPYAIAPAQNLWRNLLQQFGAGLAILAVAIISLVGIVWAGKTGAVFKRFNWLLGCIAFALALWGSLAFFNLEYSVFSQNSLGGSFGLALINRPDVFGILRVAGLFFLGLLMVAPKPILRAFLASCKGFFRALRSVKRPTIRRTATSHTKTSGEPATEATVAARPAIDPPRSESWRKAPVVTAGGWRLPPLDMLEKPVEVELSEADVEKRARQIEDALLSYGVDGKVVQINIGPTVTQFGVEPGWDHKFREIREKDRDGNVKVRLQETSKTRVKVERIASLSNDLALALASPAIRIEAPVPGKPVVGIEVPNTTFGMVNLRSVIETSSFQKARTKSNLALALGKGAGGEAVAADLARMPHLLIAGATGSGKTACLNSIITCLLLHNTPDDLRFIMIDPKRVELVSFNTVPHLAAPVVVEADKAVKALHWLIQEMDRRYKEFAKEGARNIEGYNKDKQPGKCMPYMVLIVDELADLMMAASDEVERDLCRLAQLARATGIHLIVATQRPSVDVVTGLIKANFPTRISFAVTSQIDSRTILDTVGAEKLLGRGDMLYMPTDAAKPKRLQGTFISDAETERLVYFWGQQYRPDLQHVKFEDVSIPMTKGPDGTEDPMLEQARQLMLEHKRVSASFLQRHLRIGYPRAARLMELLEEHPSNLPEEASDQDRRIKDIKSGGGQ